MRRFISYLPWTLALGAARPMASDFVENPKYEVERSMSIKDFAYVVHPRMLRQG